MTSLILTFLLALPFGVQDRVPDANNPLATLKDEVKRVLAEAQTPFTEAQESAIVLMMEDRRKASEDLFGTLMDFSAGPTQGQDGDRLRSAIEWMRNEFSTRLQNFLTPEQLAAWSRYQETTQREAASASSGPRGAPPRQQQTQFVRINNNILTAEEQSYRFQAGGGGQRSPEVIERGGAGAFHGNFQFLMKDDSLNAARRSYNLGHRLPTVKPPYSEHQTSFNLSGPVIPGHLTATLSASHNRAENVETVGAILGDGSAFGAEVVRPTINRSLGTGGTWQLSDRNSLTYNVAYAPYSRKNQGIGGFVLPERAWTTDGNNWNVELKQFSSLSARSIYESRFNLAGNHEENEPDNTRVRINVLDAFSGGGAQNQTDTTTRNYQFSNLYTRLGERLTIKTGFEGIYRKQRSLSTSNYGGTFTFSTLDAYRNARPLNYRETRGEPLQKTGQLELSMFVQNDFKLTPRATLMYGVRYDVQTNIHDHNNFGPRVGLAYALGQGTVIRAGGGIFYNFVQFSLFETQKRLDGKSQYELFIDNPSYPDPFLGGTVRNTPPSIRVTDPRLEEPYIEVGMISFERTLQTNLFLGVSYDFRHEVHRTRLRNLNATYDARASVPQPCSRGQSLSTCVRPDPTKGQVLNLEATLGQTDGNFRLSIRKRFSVLNLSANYLYQTVFTDGAPNAGGELPVNAYDFSQEWARASTFPNHTIDSTANAQLFYGVFLSGTMAFNTGRFYNITTGTDDNMDSTVNDRAPGITRNSGHAAKFLAFNFNISKAFFIGAASGQSRKNLNVFANMTNAFNHVNYGVPSGVMTSPNFGFATNGGDPRQIEVGSRFQF